MTCASPRRCMGSRDHRTAGMAAMGKGDKEVDKKIRRWIRRPSRRRYPHLLGKRARAVEGAANRRGRKLEAELALERRELLPPQRVVIDGEQQRVVRPLHARPVTARLVRRLAPVTGGARRLAGRGRARLLHRPQRALPHEPPCRSGAVSSEQ